MKRTNTEKTSNPDVSTRAELIRMLEDIRAIEIIARKGYAQDTMTFKNKEIVDKVERIKEDEDKHIRLLDELLGMLKKDD